MHLKVVQYEEKQNAGISMKFVTSLYRLNTVPKAQKRHKESILKYVERQLFWTKAVILQYYWTICKQTNRKQQMAISLSVS